MEEPSKSMTSILEAKHLGLYCRGKKWKLYVATGKFRKPFHLSYLWLSFISAWNKSFILQGQWPCFLFLTIIFWFTIVLKLQVFFWLLWHNDWWVLTLQGCLSVEVKRSGFAPSGRLPTNYANCYSAGYNLIMLYIFNTDKFCKGKLSSVYLVMYFSPLFVFYKRNHIKKW